MTEEQSQETLPEDETDAVTIKRTQRVRRRESIVGWSTVFANILVPMSICIAAWSVLEANWREQRDAAQRQIALFYSPGLSEARQSVFDFWNGVDLSVFEVARSRSFIDAFVERTLQASDERKPQVTSAIVSLALYFDQVEICISSGRCEEEDLILQIGQFGRDFYCLFAGAIESQRQERLMVSFGTGLEAFADRAGGCTGEVASDG